MEIRLKVVPGASREGVEEGKDGRFVVRVDAKARHGEANGRVRELLAGYFRVSLDSVRITRGTTTPGKTVRILKKPVV